MERIAIHRLGIKGLNNFQPLTKVCTEVVRASFGHRSTDGSSAQSVNRTVGQREREWVGGGRGGREVV